MIHQFKYNIGKGKENNYLNQIIFYNLENNKKIIYKFKYKLCYTLFMLYSQCVFYLIYNI